VFTRQGLFRERGFDGVSPISGITVAPKRTPQIDGPRAGLHDQLSVPPLAVRTIDPLAEFRRATDASSESWWPGIRR